jgi:hypothetical protein
MRLRRRRRRAKERTEVTSAVAVEAAADLVEATLASTLGLTSGDGAVTVVAVGVWKSRGQLRRGRKREKKRKTHPRCMPRPRYRRRTRRSQSPPGSRWCRSGRVRLPGCPIDTEERFRMVSKCDEQQGMRGQPHRVVVGTGRDEGGLHALGRVCRRTRWREECLVMRKNTVRRARGTYRGRRRGRR